MESTTVEGFFQSLGQAFGTVIRFIVDNLGGLFSAMGGVIGSFVDGLSKALGVTPSFLNIAVLVLGLLFLYFGVRAVLRRAFIRAIIWLLLGLWLLGGLIA